MKLYAEYLGDKNITYRKIFGHTIEDIEKEAEEQKINPINLRNWHIFENGKWNIIALSELRQRLKFDATSPINSCESPEKVTLPIFRPKPCWKQNSPSYGNCYIGNTRLKFKNFGCLISAITNILNHYLIPTDPFTFSQSCRFDKNGKLIWDSLTMFRDKKFFDFTNCDADLPLIDDLLENDFPLLCETRIFKIFKHWITIWQKTDIGYEISDPLHNETIFEKKYGNPKRWIYRIVVLKP